MPDPVQRDPHRPAHRFGRRFARAAVAGLLSVTTLAVAPGQAPLQDLDDGQFIAGLAKFGLHDLVEHMIDHPPEAMEARGRLLKGLSREYLTATADFDHWTAAFERTTQFFAESLESLPPCHPNRVLWAGDYTQGLLFSVLPNRQQADLFVAYGLPTPDQRTAAAMVAGESLKRLRTASSEWATMQRMLPRQENFVTDYVNTGQWADLQDYSRLQLPLFTARAGFYVATQRDDGPYFADLPDDADPAAARQAVIGASLNEITRAIEAGQGAANITRAKMFRLRGNLRTMNGATEQALGDYDQAAGLETDNTSEAFVTDLARAKASQRAGRADDARQLAESLFDRPIASQNPLLMILAADRLALLTRAEAEKAADAETRSALINQSYEPYQRVLNHPDVAPWRDALESFLFARFADNVAGVEDLSDRPLMVRLAVGLQSVRNGQAARNRGASREAGRLFERAISVLEPLIGGGELSKADQARALYHMGIAQFFSGKAGYAVNTFTELADQHPDNPLGERAIRIAIQIGSDLYAKLKSNPEQVGPAAELYETALNVLMARYPAIDLARTNTYALAALLRERQRWADAVEAYDNVPPNHRFYVESLYEKLVCVSSTWDQATGARREALGRQVLAGAEKFLTAAAGVARSSDRHDRIQRYQALTTVTRADVLTESMDQPDRALELLEGLDEKYPDLWAGLKSDVMRIRVRAYQRQGEFAKAQTLIRTLMTEEPNLAGPLVLGMLKSLNAEIAGAREANQTDRINQLASIAVTLSNMLVDWAKTQDPFAGDEEKMLAFELMQAQALAAAGRYEEAAKHFDRLYQTPAGQRNALVMAGLADALFHLEQDARSAKLYNKLIEYEQRKGTRTDTFWQAQVRLYTMRHRADDKKDLKIYTGISNLQRKAPDLGGEPYRTELLRLKELNDPNL